MANPYFQFKQFTVYHDRCAMKVSTDACLFGAWTAATLSQEKRPLRVLDIGAGTGLLSLMIAQKTRATIEAVEIDEEAAAQAGENIQASPWAERIHVIQKNVLDLAPAAPYDVIVSNPPFYEREMRSENAAKNMAHHSELLNLESLLHLIKTHLKNEGWFFLLFPYKRRAELASCLTKEQLFVHQEMTVKQSINHGPFRLMIKGSLTPAVTRCDEMAISDGKQYTADFVSLLRDYYLYL